jgi:hypothetical protein
MLNVTKHYSSRLFSSLRFQYQRQIVVLQIVCHSNGNSLDSLSILNKMKE